MKKLLKTLGAICIGINIGIVARMLFEIYCRDDDDEEVEYIGPIDEYDCYSIPGEDE